MQNAIIITDDDNEHDIVRLALEAAGCSGVIRLFTDDLTRLLCSRVSKPDVVVVMNHDARLLNRLVALEAPIVVICPEQRMDAAFLAGAAECVAHPIRARELEGRIRHALRVGGQWQFRRARERRMADMITDLERARSGLEKQLCMDALTEVATRRHALALLDAECRRSSRDRKPLGLVMIDFDWFNAYNAQYGHAAGDRCLKWAAAAMSRCLRRPADFIGRYGGDELVAVLPNTDLAGATYVAECIRAAVEVLAIPHHGSACADVVTISAGITSARVAADFAPDDIIQTADAALRHAKASGRNQICAACDLELGTEALVIGRAATSRAPRATSAPSNDQGAAAP